MDDHNSLAQQLYLYALAIDTRQWDLFDNIFTDDVTADYGAPFLFSGLASFKAGARAAWGAFDASQHSITNVAIRIQGDTAKTLAHGNWHIVRTGLEGGDTWLGRGWYDDSFVRSGGRWLIRNRNCRVMACSGNPGTMTPDGNYAGPMPTYSMHEAQAHGTLGFFT